MSENEHEEIEETEEFTCGDCEYFWECPCGCGWGWCEQNGEFRSADDEACDDFVESEV